jgi:predicted transglutaminase-like cysteine proteinase
MPASYVAGVVPPGFISFCVRFADQCAAPVNAPSSIAMNNAAWQTLQAVNQSVNRSIWPEDDKDHYGRAEYWTIPTDGYGNCKDYALTKRKALIAAGLPIGALRIAIVLTPDLERHAVLTVTTDRGDFVLDNMRDDIIAWNQTSYIWLERQDPSHVFGWVSLQQPSTQVAENNLQIDPREILAAQESPGVAE